MSKLICIGRINGAHGVHGRVKVQSFMAEPDDLFTFEHLLDAKGQRRFRLEATSVTKDGYIAEVEGLKGREQAEGLRSTLLYVPRDWLPDAEEDEFYYEDLIGLKALSPEGRELGKVLAMHDFGGGDIIEIEFRGEGKLKREMLPFTKAVVPVVDIKAGFLTVDIPAELVVAPAAPKPEQKRRKKNTDESPSSDPMK